MNAKKYNKVRIAVAISLALIISQAVSFKNYPLAIIAILAGMIVMYTLKKRVSEVLADERDYQLAGQAAMYSLYVYSFTATLGGFILLMLAKEQPDILGYAYLLFYTVCALMLFNSALFAFYRRRGAKNL